MLMSQAYQGACIILPTKHAKSIAIAPPCWERLGASVLEYVIDTDTLGTFSGGAECKGNALECTRRKCEWALELLRNKAEYCIANEGSFGPHPQIPFLPYDQEILYFIDGKRGFHLHMVNLTEKKLSNEGDQLIWRVTTTYLSGCPPYYLKSIKFWCALEPSNSCAYRYNS